MNFIINSIAFEIILELLIILNAIGFLINIIVNNKKVTSHNDDGYDIYYYINQVAAFIWTAIIIITIIILAHRLNITPYINIVYYGFVLIITTKYFKINIKNLSNKTKMDYVQISFLYTMIFTRRLSNHYINLAYSIENSLKYYVIILILIIKIIAFVFCVILNISVLLSNYDYIFKKISISSSLVIARIAKKINYSQKQKYYIKSSNTAIKNILNIILYVLFIFPFTLIKSTLTYLIHYTAIIISEITIYLNNSLNNYLNSSSNIMFKVLKVSTIIAFIIIYILIIYKNIIVSAETREIYSLVTTVLLIPLIYDSIKKRN